MSDKLYTKKQGQYLAYIHTYTLLHRRPPSHAEMVEFFRVTPPSVVSMLNRLQSRGLIAREPGVARSVRVLLAPGELPPLVGPDEVAPAGPQPPAPDIGLDDASFYEDLAPIYQLRIDLDGTRPPIWRRVLVPAYITFGDLNVVVESAMGWGGYHLHMFTAAGWYIGAPDPNIPGGMDDILDEDLELVSDYLTELGDRVKFEYDFGDGWMHTIKLEKITAPDPKQHYPVCIKGRRACPPDDVGGTWGYKMFLDALGDPSHHDHDRMSEWIGGEFDAEAFDLGAANARLGGIDLSPARGFSRIEARAPHVLTIRRWQMIDPDAPWETALIAALHVPPPTFASLMQSAQVPESPKALVDALWDVSPLVIGLWVDRAVSFGTSIIPFLVDGFRAAERFESIVDRAWYRDHIVLAMERLGASAIPGLLQIYESAPRASRALICIALGRLGAREYVDLIWKEIDDNPLDDGTGGFVGPLWALIDLGDPRAADVLIELFERGLLFHELWAMLSRAGDARALFPLLAATAIVSEELQSELAFTLAAIVRRLGREASIEALHLLGEVPAPDGTPLSVSDVVDVVLASTAKDVSDYFSPYYEGPTPEAVAEFARQIAQQEWQDAGPDWDLSDELGLFGDVPFFDDDDAQADVFEMGALQRQLNAIGPPTSHFPNGRPVARPGRNEPCWCGSGKKYKNCHWREDHLGDTG